MQAINSSRFYTMIKQDHYKIHCLNYYLDPFTLSKEQFQEHISGLSLEGKSLCFPILRLKKISPGSLCVLNGICLYPSVSLSTMVIKNIKDTFAGWLWNSKIHNDQYISTSQLGPAVCWSLYFLWSLIFILLLISHLNIRTVRNHSKSIVK